MNESVSTRIDLRSLKRRLLTIVEGNRAVFAELIAEFGYTPMLEAKANIHPRLAELKNAFTREIATSLMGFSLTIEPEPGVFVGGEVVKVLLTETNGPDGAQLHIITRASDHTVNEFRMPLEALDDATRVKVTALRPRRTH